ncbi:MAG: hypothetical protein MJ070_04010 [Lachnospiraceae bacterium]|nr:hypothetical protein [Lachnospiraceae bacterium]
MKKLISILLAVMTLVSLLAFSTVPVAADEEAKEYTMSAIVMMYPDDPYDDYCVTRFIFNWTEADNSDIPTGFEAWWGTGSVSDSFEYYTAVWDIPGEWHWDEKGNMCMDVYFDLPYMDAGEEYEAAKRGELQGYICDLGNGGEYVHDDFGRESVFDLVPNFTMTENQYKVGISNNAVVLVIQDEDTYYGTSHEPAATEPPVTKAPETKAPETKAPETKAPETNAPGTEAAGTDAPGTDAPKEPVKPAVNAGAIVGIIIGVAIIVGAILLLVLGGKKNKSEGK